MKLKSSMALIGMGAAGVLRYQNIKNGNIKFILNSQKSQ